MSVSQPVSVRRSQRHVHIAAGQTLTIDLQAGGAHRLVCDDPHTLAALVEALGELPGVSVLPPDGGLLGGVTVGANLALALSDGVRPAPASLDEPLTQLLSAVMPAQRIAQLHRLSVSDLNPLEAWTVGWAIDVLRATKNVSMGVGFIADRHATRHELIVLDRPAMHLNHAQQQAMMALVAQHCRDYPQHTLLWLDRAPAITPDLPALHTEAGCLC